MGGTFFRCVKFLFGLAILSLCVFALHQIWRRMRSAIDERAGWACPRCGKAFGRKAASSLASGSDYLDDLFQSKGGPLLHCAHCGEDFRFTWSGELAAGSPGSSGTDEPT